MSFAERFKAYVASQPSDKPVNHSSWRLCAIGEFVRDTDPTNEEDPYLFRATTMFKHVFGERAYDIIGDGGRGGFCSEPVPMETYGELSQWLNGLIVLHE